MVTTPQNPNWPQIFTQWDPTNGPNSASRSWYSLTSRLRTPDGSSGARCSYGRQYELNQTETGTFGVLLANKDEQLNPGNISSPYYVATPYVRQSGSAMANATNGVGAAVYTQYPLDGSTLVLTVSTNNTGPLYTVAGYQLVLTKATAAQRVQVWVRRASGWESKVSPVLTTDGYATESFSLYWCELAGVDFADVVDAFGTPTSRVASSASSQATGSVTTTSPNDLVVMGVAAHGFASASAPTAFTTSTGAMVSATPAPNTNATAAQNNVVALASVVQATPGVVSSTISWTNASTDAVGFIVAIKAAQQLVPERPLRDCAMWPSTSSGNLINATNDQWSPQHYAPLTMYTQKLANPSFDAGITDWRAFSGTASWDTTTFHSGVGSGKLVTGAGAYPKLESGGLGLIPVAPGTTVLVAAWLRADTARLLTLDTAWYDSTSTWITSASAGYVVTANTWSLFIYFATAPAGTAYMDLVGVNSGTPGAGLSMWMDDAMVWVQSTSNSPGYADAASFEGTTTGTWARSNGCLMAVDNTRAHDGAHSMQVLLQNGSAGTAAATLALPPVDTGIAYTASAWVYIPAGMPGLALQWGGVVGTGSAVTNAWTRISVTKTRTDGQDDTLYLVPTGSTLAGQQVWVDSVQFEQAASPSAFRSTGSTIYPVHSGFIERYPGTWTHNGYHGWINATSTDAMALMAVTDLEDCMTQDAMQDDPFFFYPLWDAPLSVGGMPEVRCDYPVGKQWQSISVVSGANIVVGAPTMVTWGASGGPGVDGMGCAYFGPLPGFPWIGPGAINATPGLGAPNYFTSTSTVFRDLLGAGSTYEVWVKVAASAVGQAAMTFTEINDAPGNSITIEANTSGQPIFRRDVNSPPSNFYIITGNAQIYDGNWHLLTITEVPSGGTVTATAYVDGLSVGTGSYAGSQSHGFAYCLIANGLYGRGAAQPMVGAICRFAAYPSALSATRVRSHWQSSQGFPWDTGGERVARILQWGKWTGSTAIDTGCIRVSPASGMSGKNVLSACQEAALAENSPFLVSPVGVPTLYHRDRYYKQTTSLWTLGELENAYQNDISTSTDITYLYSVVKVTGYSGVEWQVSDSMAIALYQPRTYSKSVIIRDDTSAKDLAQHWLNLYRRPGQRIMSVTLNPGKDPTMWPMVLGAKFGDRVTFRRRATAGGLLLQFDGFIDRVEHNRAPNNWATKFQISPVDPRQAWILGDATYGVLGTAVPKF